MGRPEGPGGEGDRRESLCSTWTVCQAASVSGDAQPVPLSTLRRGTHMRQRVDEGKYFLSPAAVSFHDTG